MINSNIYLIDQIVDASGKFLTYNVFVTKYGLVLSNFEYMALIDAIPAKWRKTLKLQYFQISICSIREAPFCRIESDDKDIQTLKASDIYWHLLSEKQNKPTCITSWNQLLGIEEEETLWKSIFTLPL